MKGETYLYASDELDGTADDSGVWKASDFMSAEIASATTVELRFKAASGYGTKNGVVTLTVPTLAAGAGTVKFKEICKIIAGALNKAKGNMLVLADEVNGVYINPFSGAQANQPQVEHIPLQPISVICSHSCPYFKISSTFCEASLFTSGHSACPSLTFLYLGIVFVI